MVWFGGFGFWFGIFFHIGKEDRLRTIGFPQEKLQFPRNSHWKWDLDNLWTDWKGSLQTWHETRAWNPLLMQGQTDVGSTWGGDGIWLRLFHFLFSFRISVPEEITEQNWLSDRSRQLSSSSCTWKSLMAPFSWMGSSVEIQVQIKPPSIHSTLSKYMCIFHYPSLLHFTLLALTHRLNPSFHGTTATNDQNNSAFLQVMACAWL